MKKILYIFLFLLISQNLLSQNLINESFPTICKILDQDVDYPQSLQSDYEDSTITYLSDSIYIEDLINQTSLKGNLYYIFDVTGNCFALVLVIDSSITIPPTLFKSIKKERNKFVVNSYIDQKFNITHYFLENESIFYIWSNKCKIPTSWNFIKKSK